MTTNTADTMPSPSPLTETTSLPPPAPLTRTISISDQTPTSETLIETPIVMPAETTIVDTKPADGNGSEPQTNGTASEDTTSQTRSELPRARDWTAEPLAIQPHEQKDDIIRQVEYYFGDENLPHDAHLLSKAGEFGDGWVSLSTIMSFRKMRAFKPPARVKAALSLPNDLFEVWNNKFIRRKKPLQRRAIVTPKIDPSRERAAQMIEKPWMTKAMFKPTGFEKDFVEGPITPADHETERKLFEPEEAFTERIQHAVTRYTSKRKMHQNTLKLFGSFIMFGGFAGGQAMFTGGLSKADLEEYDKDQIEAMQARYIVSDAVLDGIYEDQEGGATWVVDFETVAKSFLSMELMAAFDWKDQKLVEDATNIMINFYNYLIYHDVCPEYEEQVKKARDFSQSAGEELIKLAEADSHLPGQFNIACSTRHGGYYASIRPLDTNAEWVLQTDFLGLSDRDAEFVFSAGMMAHGTDEQVEAFAAAKQQDKLLDIVSAESMGLKVVSVEVPCEEAKVIYHSRQFSNTVVKPQGKLHCVRWDVPGAAQKDLPAHVIKQQKAKIGSRHVLLVDEDALRFCYPGLKMEAMVKKLSNGIEFIDHYEHVYPSFYTWSLNSRIRDWKETGKPKAWMKRQMEKKGKDGQELVRGEGEEQNTPD